MKKEFVLAGLVAMLATSVAVTPTVIAQSNRDPLKTGCHKDAKTVGSPASIGFTAPYDIRKQNGQIVLHKGQLVEVKVELRGSEKCQGKWVKAYNVPENTILYIEDNSRYPRRYVTYKAGVDGQNFSDMTNQQDYQKPLRACVQFPQDAYKYSDQLRQPLCTGFN